MPTSARRRSFRLDPLGCSLAVVLVVSTCVAWPIPAAAFSAAWRAPLARPADALLRRAKVICDERGRYCEDGWVCLHGGKNDNKCEPGPEMRRKAAEKATKEYQQFWRQYHKNTVQKSDAESAHELQQLERRAREQGGQKSSAPAVAPSPPGESRIRTGLPGVPGVMTGPKPPPPRPPVVATQHPPAPAPRPAAGTPGMECQQILAPGQWAYQTVCRPIASSQGGTGNGGGSASAPRNNGVTAPIPEVLSNLGGASRTPPGTPPAPAPSEHGSPSPRAALPPAQQGDTPPDAGSCPPVAPAKNWEGTPNADYCANANCVDRGSAYYGVMCYAPTATADGGNAAPTPQAVARRREKSPARFKGAAPDIRTELLALGDSIIDTPDDDPARDRLVRLLEQRLAKHRVRVKPQDLACLQPVRGTSPRRQDIPLRWKPEHIKKEAIERSHLCDGVPEGDARDACREDKYGDAVMWGEPELAGQCRTAEMPNNNDIDAVAACAKRKFLSAWANSNGIASAPTPDNWILPAPCNANGPLALRKKTLRDILMESLAATETAQPNDGGSGNDKSTPGPTVADTPPPSPPATDENEAYCDYMARAVVRGELTPGPTTAIPPACRAAIAAALALKAKQKADGALAFTMDAEETDREIARLMGPSRGRPQAGAQGAPPPDGRVVPK